MARLSLLLAAAVAVPAALLPLVPEHLRPWNFAAFGAVAVFAAARGGRFGWAAGLALALGGKLVSDLLNDRHRGFEQFQGYYLSIAAAYVGIALYAGFGRLAARRSDWWGVPAGLAGSASFFLLTNAVSWWQGALDYDRGPLGLLQAYAAGLPFHTATLVSDLVFTAGLFAAHAVAAWATRPAAVAAPVRS